jgi:hypothetical protein
MIPELRILPKYLRELSNGESRIIIFVNQCPDPEADDSIRRKYYDLYVGEEEQTHTVRLYSFFVSKDLTSVLSYDPVSDRYTPMDKIRAGKKWKKDWDEKRRWLEEHEKLSSRQ